MNRKLLNYFKLDLDFMDKGPRDAKNPTKKDKDIYAIETIVKNALKLDVTNPESKQLKEKVQNYLIKNVAEKGVARNYLSSKTIDLTHNDFHALRIFNNKIKQQLTVQNSMSNDNGMQN